MKKIKARARNAIAKNTSRPLLNFDTSDVLMAIPSFADISAENTSTSCLTMQLNHSRQASIANNSESAYNPFQSSNHTIEFCRLSVDNLDIMLLQQDEAYWLLGRIEQLNGRLKFYEQIVDRLQNDCTKLAARQVKE